MTANRAVVSWIEWREQQRGEGGGNYQGSEEMFAYLGYVHYLVCGNGFIGVYMYQNLTKLGVPGGFSQLSA